MIEVHYKPSFVKQFANLEPDLQEEVLLKINLLKNRDNHKMLKVHKIKGQLGNFYSFSVNYRVRVVFEFKSKKEVVLLVVGSHNIYK